MEATLSGAFAEEARRARQRARVALAGAYDLDTDPGQEGWAESWRVQVDAPHAESLELRIGPRFPYELPDAYVDPALFGVVPHVDARGKLCYVDEGTASFVPKRAPEVALWAVERCVAVLSADQARALEEIAQEFAHYWAADEAFLSLLEDLESPREVDLLWLDKAASRGFAFLACEDIEDGKEWLARSNLGRPTVGDRALFLPRAISPKPPYPSTNEEAFVRMEAGDADAFALYRSFLRQIRERSIVLSSTRSERGDALFGWSQPRTNCPPPRYRGGWTSGEVPGFRPGRHPVGLEMRGWGASLAIERYRGERIDLPRLRDRTSGSDGSGAFRHLVLVGAGSLGSGIAMELVRSQAFERVSIVDPDLLKVENVLRHACGFSDVNEPKALALGRAVGRACPWVRIDVLDANVLDCLDDVEGWLETADLVLLATGVDALERSLAERFLRCRPDGLVVHRVWVTAEAARGCVVRQTSAADEPGPAPITDAEAVRYEPGCSPGYAQYGGSRLRRFVAVASDAILSPVADPWRLEWIARPLDSPLEPDVVERTPLALRDGEG